MIEKILNDLQDGKIILLKDDESRENEADFVMAAEKVTAKKIAFILRYGSGIICVPMSEEQLQLLEIPLMVSKDQNTESHRTAFTVSVDAKDDITTGISASDRAKTIALLANEKTHPKDLVRPGHVFPLSSHPKGLEARRGHTEASLTLMKMAKLKPISIICECVNDDGTVMRGSNLIEFSQMNNLNMISINEILECTKKIEAA